MSSRQSERRTLADRRRAARGGRRPHDQPGYTPLVLVIGHGGTPQRESEAILRELKFAVAPAADMAEAIRVVEGVHPDLIVAQRDDAAQLRAATTVDVPIVEYENGAADAAGLVERVRRAIRNPR